jgi:Fe-S cluster assembly protein SufD
VTRLADVSASARDALALSVDAVRLVFVDGVFRPELSDRHNSQRF